MHCSSDSTRFKDSARSKFAEDVRSKFVEDVRSKFADDLDHRYMDVRTPGLKRQERFASELLALHRKFSRNRIGPYRVGPLGDVEGDSAGEISGEPTGVTSGRPWRSCSMLGCLLGETEHVERAGDTLREDPSCHSHATFSRISCSRVGSVIVNRAHTVKVLALLKLLNATLPRTIRRVRILRQRPCMSQRMAYSE